MSLISFRTDRDQATARAASGSAWGVILLTGVPDQRPRRGPADIEEACPWSICSEPHVWESIKVSKSWKLSEVLPANVHPRPENWREGSVWSRGMNA